MTTESKTLRLNDMIFNRQGAFIRRVIHAVVSIALRLFFRRIETVNASEVPYQGGLMFVVNHPNGLIDPALVFVALPRKISFLAKSTLFNLPVISYVLRVVEALPVYRRVDKADVSKNPKTFEACHNLLQKGGAIAIFPEGISHNSPKLLPIKTGAARIALGALSVGQTDQNINLKIVPVGLYYTNKTTFRSEALLYFGEMITVKPVEIQADGELPSEAVKDLTDEIENALREVTLNAETNAEIETANHAAHLFLSATETFDLEKSLAAQFKFIREYLKDRGKKETFEDEKITQRISQYNKKLGELGIEPENLSFSGQPFRYVFRHFFIRVGLLLFFLPFTIVGTILHFPAYQISKILASRYTKHGVDDIVSTVKILSGIIFMPLTWIILAGVLYFYFGWQIALASIPISFFCGYIALRSLEEIADMRGWFRAIWLFFRKRDLFLELLLERRALYRELKESEK